MAVAGAAAQAAILTTICFVAFVVRLFAVIRYESVIHEFDPYFNFRVTQILAEIGMKDWWNWFDAAAWYPLGRSVGQTLFPGLMVTGYVMWQILRQFGFPISIRDVCVFTAPIFSGFTCLSAYWLCRLACKRLSRVNPNVAGMLSAAFMAIVPSYISRSVAGSYDNEAVSIFALVFAFATYVHALQNPTGRTVVFAALAYAYMVASWGGYVFITNTVAIHALACIMLNKATVKHYAVYCGYYVLGTVFCLNIPFVSLNAITSSEHLASHGLFFAMQALFAYRALQYYAPFPSLKTKLRRLALFSIAAIILVYLYLVISGRTKFGGRSMTLLDPTYASKHNPIVASVSEHQPPTWYNYLFDLSGLSLFIPLGLWLLFGAAEVDGGFFVGIYGILAVYFSCVMVRLMLVFSPAACIIGSIGIAEMLGILKEAWNINKTNSSDSSNFDRSNRRNVRSTHFHRLLLIAIAGTLFYTTLKVWLSGVFVSAVAYSSPSIVLSGYTADGRRIIQDDFREAYYWLRHNSPKGARLMSWWDYGYQSAAMADRAVIVDNNTWNNTHIATVGLAFASPEKEAWEIVSKLDVDYVFVVFGGFARYSGDDLNKFIWMVRIAAGVYPQLKVSDYFTPNFEVGDRATRATKESLMYKLSYHNYASGATNGVDFVRRERIPDTGELTYFEEAYTTENWMVRIFKVKKSSDLIVQY